MCHRDIIFVFCLQFSGLGGRIWVVLQGSYTCVVIKGDFMKSEKRELSDQEKHDAAVELLKKLKDKLNSSDISTARKAAYNLSWKQEDGLTILRDTLFGNDLRTAKKAAAYGLRGMKGRMRKMAMEVLKQGLTHRNRTTKAACEKALFLMEGGTVEKASFNKNRRTGRPRIQGIRNKSRAKTRFTGSRTSFNR